MGAFFYASTGGVLAAIRAVSSASKASIFRRISKACSFSMELKLACKMFATARFISLYHNKTASSGAVLFGEKKCKLYKEQGLL